MRGTIGRKRKGASSTGLSDVECQRAAALAGDTDAAVARQSGRIRFDGIIDGAAVAVSGRYDLNPRCQSARRPDAAVSVLTPNELLCAMELCVALLVESAKVQAAPAWVTAKVSVLPPSPETLMLPLRVKAVGFTSTE